MERAKAQRIPVRYWNPLQKGETVETPDGILTPDMVLGPDRRGLKVAYCTDTRPVERIAEHAAGADLFICEGMYGEPDKAAKAKEYRHMTFAEAAQLGKKAQPKAMWLTHSHRPWFIRNSISRMRGKFSQPLRQGRTEKRWN